MASLRSMKKRIALAVGAAAVASTVQAFNILVDGNAPKQMPDGSLLYVLNADTRATVVGKGKAWLLLVGGGGGGGKNHATDAFRGGAGGGAGGLLELKSQDLTAGSYPIVIGAGGALGQNGGDSSAFGFCAIGGGGGGNANWDDPSWVADDANGKDGGSGGGAATYSGETSGVPGRAIAASSGLCGHDGAAAIHRYAPGGGGGAGEAGHEAPPIADGSLAGQGGAGLELDITGEKKFYAGGGGGFMPYGRAGKGGAGGGGTGDIKGTDGLGGGGGGNKPGGSGVVIVRFTPTDTPDAPDSADFAVSGTGEFSRLQCGDDVMIFRENGSVSVTGAGNFEVLLVGGGGGGGLLGDDLPHAGGGGAGGFVHLKNVYLGAGQYDVVVGSGGAAGTGADVSLQRGGDSTFAWLTAYGGGGGAPGKNSTLNINGISGGDGGSGGGSCHAHPGNAFPGGKAAYVAALNSGYDGVTAPHVYVPGGGGGAGGPGGVDDWTDSSDLRPMRGGPGLPCDITGVTTYYAGGGAGWRNGWAAQPGGIGGGGKSDGNGVDGLGGGGGGQHKGGSGIVVLRYRRNTNIPHKDSCEPAVGGTYRKLMIEGVKYGLNTFTENGSFTVAQDVSVDILLVGGGGGGGKNEASDAFRGGAGGGGGGLVSVTNFILKAGTYPIVVGAGGALGQNGGDSSAFGFCALGGGGGADSNWNDPSWDAEAKGKNGGSGGGAVTQRGGTSGVPGRAIAASSGLCGHDGAAAIHQYAPGGGGGAGEAGHEAPPIADGSLAGQGGAGLELDITGEKKFYAGGGGGFMPYGRAGRGGAGGGGTGDFKGADGLGGGGGGNKPGGSGVVIIRYQLVRKGLFLVVR